jgi:hypothetical protein
MVLLHGSELNIAADGSVDWDEDFLSGFDICVASIQSQAPIPKHMNCRPASRLMIASAPVEPACRQVRDTEVFLWPKGMVKAGWSRPTD